MELTVYDACTFLGFLLFVAVFAIWAARKRKTAEDYFLAGRNLGWFVIGVSLITLSISLDHFVGMAGQGYQYGLEIATYEWMAAAAMVLVAVFLLPKLLRVGVTTIPEYLEHRYSPSARRLMAFYLIVVYVFVAIAAVLYAGSLSLKAIFGEAIEKTLVDFGLASRDQIAKWSPDWLLVAGIWAFGIIAGIYTIWGGLRAVVCANVLYGLALVLGALVLVFLGLLALGQVAADEEAARKARIAAVEVEAAADEPGAEGEKPAASDTAPPAEAENDGDGELDPSSETESAAAKEASAESKSEAATTKEAPAESKREAGAAEAKQTAPKEKAAASESKVASPESKVTVPKSKVTVPESKATVPKSKVTGQESEVAAPEAAAEPAQEAVTPAAAAPAQRVRMAWHKRLVLGAQALIANAGTKLSAVKPFNHSRFPWIAVFLGGLWISQLFYWGLNQSTTQRVLGARSVAQGQRGLLFAACLKLLVPLIIVFPAIMAFEMYGHTGPLPDRAYPRLIGQVLPAGLCGLMLAVLFGAVMSCLDSMLHAASTIFTMDFVKRGKRRAPSDRSLVWIGRLMAALFVVIGCGSATLATQIGGGLLDSVETILGYISPGVMAVFVFGLVSKRAPAAAATGAMLLGIPVYAWLLWMLPEIAFFYHVAFTFIALVAYMMFVTILLPLRDVLASGAEEQAAEPPSGFVRRLLIPYGTAILGGLLFAMPVFVYSHVVTVKYQLPDWAHFTSAGVVLMVWVLVTVVLLARPALAVRKVTALARRPSFVRGVGRWLGRLIGVVILAAVLGLHVYLLGTWVTAKLPVTAQTVDWLKPCVAWLEPYATESFDVTLPAVVRKRPQAETLVFVPQQPLPEKPGAKEEAEGEKVTGGAKAAPKAQAPALPPIEPPARWPHLESEVQQQRALGGGFTYQTRRMPLFLLPLGLTAVIVGLFLIGVVLLWFQPAPGEADLPVTNKIDLAPGAFVHGWGVIILVLIGGLYWLFF